MKLTHLCRLSIQLCLLLLPTTLFAKTAIYKDPTISVEKRVQDLVSRMTLEEKVELLGGTGFATKPNERLGIPSLKMTDGPVGVRWGKATAFPSGISMGATFNPSLLYDVSAAMGRETRALGRDMLLGPCINITRTPFGGRNFESFGEDPFLTSALARSYVQGLQGQHVLASTKHFGLNEQEHERMTINVIADERTMMEIHFPAFQAAVDAGTWSVMASYNKLNGRHASENGYLLNKVLKSQMGFQGFVVSDWEATHSTVRAANSGLDLEMPTGLFFNEKLLKAVRAGHVSQSKIDDKVRRILRSMMSMGLFEQKEADRPPMSIVSGPEHKALALKLAQESMVLLKNDQHILPLSTTQPLKVAVLGPNAKHARTGGGGSSMVNPPYAVNPWDGLVNRAPQTMQLRYAYGARMPTDFDTIPKEAFHPEAGSTVNGLKAEYFNNRNLEGTPAATEVVETVDFDWSWEGPYPGINTDEFSIRYTAQFQVPVSGVYTIATANDDGVRVYLDGKEIISDWQNHATLVNSAQIALEAGRVYDFRMEYFDNIGSASVRLGWFAPESGDLEQAVALAKQSDVAVIFAGLSYQFESEGYDRESLELTDTQVQLIEAVSAVNPQTIVVLNSGAPVIMANWANHVKAIVQAWYPGQEGGNAIADILLGRVNPSGKLPVTFLKRWEDSSAFGRYPGQNGVVRYSEGIFVGYRHFDQNNIEPEFPFGHGLSYTSFAYSPLKIEMNESKASAPKVRVSLDITNSGAMPGAEVVQLYVSDMDPKITRAPQELKGFQKVELGIGETKRVTFDLDASAFAYYDAPTHRWKVLPSQYAIRVGSSSRDIRVIEAISLK